MAANGKHKGNQGKGGDKRSGQTGPQNGLKGEAPAPATKSLNAALSTLKSEGGGSEPEAHDAAPEAAASSAEPGAAPHAPHAPQGAAWAHPIARFEERWTWFESRLITFVLLWQLAALTAWVFLNGLSESVGQSAGVVFRAVGFGTMAGLAAWFGAKKQEETRRRNITLLALALGLSIAPLWRNQVLAAQKDGAAGFAMSLAAFDKSTAGYFDNIKGWLQEGSTLTLLGGLRGLGTRLTLWLALLGGSLATAAGKHIHIDVIFRFLPKKLRIPAALVNYSAAAIMCFAGAWGFFDHVAIESYGANKDDTAGSKIARAGHEIGDHLFFTRKQAGLDLRSMPHVLGGTRYDQWMTAVDWNTWVDEAGFDARFKPDEIKSIRVPESAPHHAPLIISPAGESTRGVLAHTLGLVFPFGLIAIGLRFLLRAILTFSGHISADPNEAHKEDLKSASRTHLDGPAAEGGV